jgi:hypothetical protein
LDVENLAVVGDLDVTLFVGVLVVASRFASISWDMRAAGQNMHMHII